MLTSFKRTDALKMHGKGTLIIASCNNDVSWASRFEGSVVVVEQCTWPRGNVRVKVVRARRCGREAGSYLSFILQAWDTLPPEMFFFQGDAPRHFKGPPHFRVHRLASFSMIEGTGTLGTSSCQLAWRDSLPLHRHIANLTIPVTTYTYAHFYVRRTTVTMRKRAFYERLQSRLYDGRTDSATCSRRAASTLERLWPLIFGCSSIANYTHKIWNPTAKDYLSACPGKFCCAGVEPLVCGEISPIACESWHGVHG